MTDPQFDVVNRVIKECNEIYRKTHKLSEFICAEKHLKLDVEMQHSLINQLFNATV